jgi:hypothetical protein
MSLRTNFSFKNIIKDDKNGTNLNYLMTSFKSFFNVLELNFRSINLFIYV